MGALGGMNYRRITDDAAQMGGQRCIRSTRIPVASVADIVVHGMDISEILASDLGLVLISGDTDVGQRASTSSR